MDKKEELIDSITTALEQDTVSDINEITHRECSSENNDGFSMTITGYIVEVKPILEVVEKFDNWRVEHIGMYGDIPKNENETGYGITLFCAYCNKEYTNNIFT